MSPQYSLNKADLLHIGKVMLYSAAAAAIAVPIGVLEHLNVPTQYAVLVPVVNAVLVGVERFLAAGE